MFDNIIEWKFQSELFLEDFVWENIDSLFNLKGLARQHYLDNQICDILAINEKQQLTILELKNTEDRYIIQQLTRYYDAIQEHRPFEENVNYELPIHLVAFAPYFHKHNLIDLRYSKLTIELFTFQITSDEVDNFRLELKEIEKEGSKFNIPEKFHQFLSRCDQQVDELKVIQLPPPKSLRKLTEALSSEQEVYVLSIRDRLLSYDERIREKGFTTRTVYGLCKGDKDVYKTKLCAEFVSDNYNDGVRLPQLRLRLPYPKREFGGKGRTYKKEPVKGLTWAEVKHEKTWDETTPITLFFYLSKSQSYSFAYNLEEYSKAYYQLTKQNKSLQSFDDLLQIAIEEWKYLV